MSSGPTITAGGYQPPGTVHNRAIAVFEDELRSRLGDGVHFEFDGNMPESRGIKAADLLTLVESGELTMCYFSASYLAGRVPELALFDLPFVIDSRERAYGLLDGPLGQAIRDRFLAETGFRVLGFWDNGFRHFSNRVRTLHGPEDCAGLRVRTMDSEIHKQAFTLLGMEPTHVDVRDLVEATASGDIDAQENPLTNIYRFGMHRLHRYITLSGHFFGVSLLLVHNGTFESWPEDVRDAVNAAAAAATSAQHAYAAAEDEEMLAALAPPGNEAGNETGDETLTEIHRLTAEERRRFMDAVRPVLEAQRAKLGEHIFAYLDLPS